MVGPRRSATSEPRCAGPDLAGPRLVPLVDVVEHRRAAGLGHQLGAEADQAAGRHEELEAHPAGAVVDDLLHAPLAEGEELGDDAEELVGHVDGDPVDGLVDDAVDLAGEHLGLADGELEALPAHHLDEHGELQLAAALHLPGVGPLGGQHPDRHVADQLGVEPALHQAGGELAALQAGERRGVDADRHRQARLVDGDDRQRARVVGVGEGLADGDLGDAGDGRRSRPGRPRRPRTRSRLSVT